MGSFVTPLLVPVCYVHDLFRSRDVSLNKEIWWWGMRRINNVSIHAEDGIGALQCVFKCFACIIIAAASAGAGEKILDSCKTTHIFSSTHYAIFSVVFLIGGLYQIIIGLRLLFKQGEESMEAAFKDILSEAVYNELPFIREYEDSSNLAVFRAVWGGAIVIRYWTETEIGWTQKAIAFSQKFLTGYEFEEKKWKCEINEVLYKETALLLKELFTKGECDRDPLNPYWKSKILLNKPQ